MTTTGKIVVAVLTVWLGSALVTNLGNCPELPVYACYEDQYAISVDGDNGRCVSKDNLFLEDGSPFTFEGAS